MSCNCFFPDKFDTWLFKIPEIKGATWVYFSYLNKYVFWNHYLWNTALEREYEHPGILSWAKTFTQHHGTFR